MEKSIILNFPPRISRDERTQLTQLVNNGLSSISNEISAWSGFVDVLINEAGNYTLIANADNADLRDLMQDLLEKIDVNIQERA